MARKKKNAPHTEPKLHGYIAGAGEIVEQKIADTIEENYMPYAMSVILSRAIPEIDGFKSVTIENCFILCIKWDFLVVQELNPQI